jgi:hypothetical protein
MLRATQEHIPAHRTFQTAFEAATAVQEHHRPAVLCAAVQKRGAQGHVAKANDRPKMQQGDPELRLSLDLDP